VLLIAIVAYGGMRALRPEEYGGTGVMTGLRGDLDRALLHFDFGEACMFRGCPKVRELWARGYEADLWLLGGGLLFGVVGGVGAGVWCATRWRSPGARALEAAAMLAFCTPVYVVGLGVLLLFSPAFGVWHLPFFFDPHSYVSPRESPWGGLRSLLVPSLIVGAPLGAMCLRLTVALTRDALGEKPHPDRDRQGRDAPAGHPPPRGALGLRLDRVAAERDHPDGGDEPRARGVGLLRAGLLPPHQARPGPGHTPDDRRPHVAGARLWAAVLIVVMSAVADIALVKLDPRLRATGPPPG
jgi:hypothetical protein